MPENLSQEEIDKLLKENLGDAPTHQGSSATKAAPVPTSLDAAPTAPIAATPINSLPKEEINFSLGDRSSGEGDGGNGPKLPAELLEKLKGVLDIRLQVTVEIGRTRLLIEDLLDLHKGSVIELAKNVSQPLDLIVNGVKIAEGEAVVVNDKFGLRLTEIKDHATRINSLGG